MNLRLCASVTTFVFLLCVSFSARSAPNAELWDFWLSDNTASNRQVNHSTWQQILDRYLDVSPTHSLFDYRSVTNSDKKLLKQYLATLSMEDPGSLSREQQFAYWVNLYNSLTVQLIIQNYPVESIRSLGKGLFSFGPWNDPLITVAGQPLTLNDIEHRILRPIWADARIHYVVNCASLGCPDLPAEAFTGDNNERLLEAAATGFINQDKGVLLEEDTIRLSSIFDWYSSDFGDQSQRVSHLARYASEPRRGRLKTHSESFSFGYNWDLNEVVH